KIYGHFEKFQNYTPVAPCLGDRPCRPLPGRQDLNVKKITFRSWRPGRIKQRTCKIDIKSEKNRKNINSTVLDSMKQDLQLLLYKVFHLINVSCSILNINLMHFYLNLKIHLLDACHLWP